MPDVITLVALEHGYQSRGLFPLPVALLMGHRFVLLIQLALRYHEYF